MIYWSRRAVRSCLARTHPETERRRLIFGGIVVGCAFIGQNTVSNIDNSGNISYDDQPFWLPVSPGRAYFGPGLV